MSSLTISEEKIRQAMAEAAPLAFEAEEIKLASYLTVGTQEDQLGISGTVTVPPNNELARRFLRAAFRRVDQFGTAKTDEELNSEFDEMRRR